MPDQPITAPSTARPVSTTVVPFEGPAREGDRRLAEEMAVQVVYATVPFAVMMMTPADFADFATGFSLTEGVIESAADIRGVRVEEEAPGLRLVVDLVPQRLHAHLSRRRTLSGRTGCGVCGIDDLSQIPLAQKRQGPAWQLDPAAVQRALAALPGEQPLTKATGAAHAAAFVAVDGTLVAVREDVGRHNALDKLVGAVLRAGIEPATGFVLVTSRASFEMVEKVAALGSGALVAISAPTALALDRARHHGLTLAGIARSDSMTVFNGGA